MPGFDWRFRSAIEPLAETRVELVVPKGRAELEVIASATTDDEGWAELTAELGQDVAVRIHPDWRNEPLVTGSYKLTEARRVIDPIEVPPPASILLRLELSSSLIEAVEAGLMSKLMAYIRPVRGAAPAGGTFVQDRGTTIEVPIHDEVLVEDLTPGRWSILVTATTEKKMYVLNPGSVDSRAGLIATVSSARACTWQTIAEHSSTHGSTWGEWDKAAFTSRPAAGSWSRSRDNRSPVP